MVSSDSGPGRSTGPQPGLQEPGSSFMHRLDPAERDALASVGREVACRRREVLFREGEPGETLYIVLAGRLAIVREDPPAQPVLLGQRGPGDVVGEMGVIGHRPRFATAVAAEDSRLLAIRASEFRALLATRPGIGRAIADVLSERLEASDLARSAVVREEQELTGRVERLSTEAERLAELGRLRQETVDLIVHDLRSPLTVIAVALELLQASLPEEAAASAADVFDLVQRSSRRLLSLIESLLQAAQQDETSLPMERQPIDLATLLCGVVAGLALAAEQRYGISLVLDLPPGLPRPCGDAAQVERVIGNLLDNALAYTPSGGRVTVSAAVRDDAVEVSVTDTGPGVPPEYRTHIFERFGRVHGTEGRRRGFGLGLYFCRRVAEAHGGRIWVEPGPGGVGSRFVLSLPLNAGTQ